MSRLFSKEGKLFDNLQFNFTEGISMAKKMCMLLACVVLALTGCASLKQEAGFEVQPKTSVVAEKVRVRQEPWHNVTLMGDIRQEKEIAIAVVNLPEPLPSLWQEELVDKGRTYAVKTSDGKQARKPLERVVFRAMAYTKDGQLVEMFDAVVTPAVNGLFILLPAERAEMLKAYQFVIVPSDATWLMTTQKEMVTLAEGQDLARLPVGFFAEHPSPLRQVIKTGATHPVFTDLARKFPNHFSVKGIPYSGRPDADIVLAQFTSLDTTLDKVVSCGSFTVAPGMAVAGVAVSIVRNVWVVSKRDCLK